MKNKLNLVHIFDLFFSIRPILLIPVWGFCSFGFFSSSVSEGKSLINVWNDTSIETYLVFIIFSLSVGVVYLLNQIADIEVDKKNGGLPLLASGIITLKEAWISSVCLFLLSVIIPLIMKKPIISFFSICSVVIGILYSFKPAFFSGRMFFDFLTNAFGYGCIAFGVGWWIGGGNIFSNKFLITSLPYFFLMCSGSINSTLPDAPGDKADGKFTTAVMLGNKNAHLLSTAFLIIASILSIIYKDYIAAICALVSLPIFILYLIKPSKIVMEATYKVAGAVCMIIACIIIPYILVVAFCIFYGTKIYFKNRHGVNYPSMVPLQYDK